MTHYKLKLPKSVQKTADVAVGAHHAIEDGVVGTYQKIEDTVVGAYKKIEGKFVDTFLEEVSTQDQQTSSNFKSK